MTSSLPKMRINANWPRQAFLVVDRAERVVHVSGSTFATLGLPETTGILGTRLTDMLRLITTPYGGSQSLLDSLSADIASTAWRVGHAARSLVLTDGRALSVKLEPFAEQYCAVHMEETTVNLEAEHVAATKAYHDYLTGLSNRALFERTLGERLAQLQTPGAHKAIVLFMDLDRFKVVNDTLGHAVGDELLRLVSQRLQSVLSPADTLARMGGDEFAILLAQPGDEQAAATLAARIIDLIQRTYLIDGFVVNIGVSIGMAVAPQDGSPDDHVLRCADLALYHSKAAGGGVFSFFEPAMQEAADTRRALEVDLRKALLLRQFELHYQPQIDVESQTITGMEALLRWRHPTRGLVLPADFLAFAEEIGLVLPLTEWVLKTACREAMRWPVSMTVAVNVSPLQLEAGKFIECVTRALESTGLPGSRLEIEVTEDSMQRDNGSVLRTLGKLRQLEVRVVIGSFGIGIASLSRLVTFPFSKIKIDRAVIGLHRADDVRSRAIVCAISALGHSLGIATLAEGVETPDQLAKVQSQGCQSVQGFYYSRPLPAQELDSLFANTFPAAPATTILTSKGDL